MKKYASLILCLAMVLQFLPPVKASASSSEYITTLMEETEASFVYSGNWDTVSGDYSGGTAKSTTDPNASVSFAFEGVGFRYIGEVSPHNEAIEIVVDGQSIDTIVPRSGPKGAKQVLYEKLGLANGAHQVLIRSAEQGKKNSKRPIMNIDAVEIVSERSTVEPEPSVIDAVYENPPMPEPSVTDSVYDVTSLLVEARTLSGKADSNQIHTFFTIRNTGTTSVPLSELSIRYWYTKDSAVPQVLECDWAVVGCSSVTSKFVDAVATDADTYAELSFTGQAGILAAGAESGVIQTRIHRTDWSKYDQSNDYSYREKSNSLQVWTHVTLYRNGQLIWGEEPTPIENPIERLVVEYKNRDKKPSDNQIAPIFNVKNVGDTAVPLSELTLRYWYTKDTDQTQQFSCDWSPVGCGNISGSFGYAEDSDYLEIRFASSAGFLARGADTGEIETRINNKNWANYDESNDHSYLPASKDFVLAKRVTLYRNGQLVWGVEPVGEEVEPEVLNAPENVTSNQDASNDVTVSWTPIEGAVGYKLYRSINNDDFKIVAELTDTESNYADNSYANQFLSEDTLLSYYVTSVSKAGLESGPSVTAEAALAASAPITAELVCVPHDPGSFIWNLHNTNPFNVAFQGNGIGGESYSGVIPANGTYALSVPASAETPLPVVEIYVQGVLQTVLDAGAAECPVSLLSAEAVSSTEVILTFDQPLDVASASIASNYSIMNLTNQSGLQALSPQVLEGGLRVRLSTQVQTSNGDYAVTVTNVRGIQQQELKSGHATFKGFLLNIVPTEFIKGNLVLNGSFERNAGTSGVADRWNVFVSADATSEFEVTNNPVASGNHAQKLSANNLSTGSRVMVYQEIPVEENRVYKARGKIKVEALDGAKVLFYLDFIDTSGNWIGTRVTEATEVNQDFQEISIQHRVPQDATKVTLYVIVQAMADAASAIVYLDDLSFVYDSNLLLNGDFEHKIDPASGTGNHWVGILPSEAKGTFQIEQEQVHTGSQAQGISGNSLLNGERLLLHQQIYVEDNKAFQASANVYAESLTNAKVQLYIDFTDTSGNWIGSAITEQLTPNQGYEKIHVKARVPKEASQANVYIILQALADNSSGVVHIDDVSFEYDDNQLLNDSFDGKVEPSGLAEHWQPIIPSGISSEIKVVNNPIASGDLAMHITASGLRAGERVMLLQQTPVEANKAYEASGSILADSLNNSKVQLYLDFTDSSGRWIGSRIAEVTNVTEGYQKITIRDRVPVGAENANVYIILQSMAESASGSIYLDNIQFAYVTNRLLNEGFETISDESGMAEYWGEIIPGGVTANVQLVNDNVLSGSHALQISGESLANGDRVMVFQEAPIMPNKIYEATANIAASSLANSKALVYLDFLDSSGNWIGSQIAELTTGTTEYQMIHIQDIAPSRAARVTFFVILQAIDYGASGTLFVDDVSLTIH